MRLKFVHLSAVTLSVLFSPVEAGTFGEDCRAYAKAVFAVAEARDNLDEPSWEKVQELHPILKEIQKKEGRGYLYAMLISQRVINKGATPRALMNNTYESCLSPTGLCMLYNQGCGPKEDK